MTHGIEQVVERGMCIGCGACSVRTSGAIPVTIGRRGVYEARLDGVDQAAVRTASRVCPFSDDAKNEDVLASERFPDLPKDDRLGAHLEIVAGRRTSEQEIVGSSSGGLTSLLLEELLHAGLVDGVLHVGRSPGDSRFSYTVSTSPGEIEQNRKSMYSATTLADVVAGIRGDGRTYAVVGVPCFIKALRLLADELPDLGAQFGVYVGLVCGHLKSTFFAESLAWQAGVPPTALDRIDFRVKNSDRYAWDYDYDAVSTDGEHHVRRSADTIDGGWGFGAFQPEACNFCDDVFAEGADVAFADAWLHKYAADWRGTNAVVIRDERVRRLLRSAAERGRVELEPLSTEDAARSQAGGFRHRRAGLSLRLADDLAAGLSVPVKRVEPDRTAVSRRRAAVLRQRRRISRLSLIAFADARKAGDYERYAEPMRRAIRRYRLLDAWSQGAKALARHVARPVVHRARRMLRR
ncbi:Coenzyme F420 hydrogenase/dehydrogenase, beta subunit C-terminal domain [Agromyces sp. SYSU T00266]|uniref:Coenzyme F420 hydrogenase/dehydrogenase, beta subunit C-terminal domain n=1 Tax=Agromyces zhanjiangensis TaxID=3158562 RepID=UPI0033986233